jgi:hypothetical protein
LLIRKPVTAASPALDDTGYTAGYQHKRFREKDGVRNCHCRTGGDKDCRAENHTASEEFVN